MLKIYPILYSSKLVETDSFGSDIAEIVFHAGPMVKFILFALFFFSVVCWAIIFMKLRLFKKFKEEDETFLEIFSSSRDLGKAYTEAKSLRFSPLAKIFRNGYSEFNRYRMIQKNPDEQINLQPRHPILDSVQRTVNKILYTQGSILEKGQTFLATTGNTSPFIGLFGTVWGIMSSFRSIGITGSADLAVVAPGIAEALIATAAGLAAAIPAVVAFNYFNRRIRKFQTEMENFISEFMGLLEKGLIRKSFAEK